MKSVLRSAGLWFALVLLSLAADLISLRLRGKLMAPRQLSVDGILLVAAVILILLFQGVTYLRRQQMTSERSHWPFLDGIAIAIIFGLPVLLLLSSLAPGLGSLRLQREYVITPPAPLPVNGMGTVVLFQNGVRTLRPNEAARLKQQLEILNRCNVADLRVVGFASSAPYRDMNEERNLRLANLRANAVVKALAKVQVGARVDTWRTYQEMVTQRRIRDTDTGGKRIETLQSLNRRVEILWRENQGCSQ
jgi:outer membrane protein OmpA-like peptidoglycan-associated protein